MSKHQTPTPHGTPAPDKPVQTADDARKASEETHHKALLEASVSKAPAEKWESLILSVVSERYNREREDKKRFNVEALRQSVQVRGYTEADALFHIEDLYADMVWLKENESEGPTKAENIAKGLGRMLNMFVHSKDDKQRALELMTKWRESKAITDSEREQLNACFHNIGRLALNSVFRSGKRVSSEHQEKCFTAFFGAAKKSE